MDGSTPDGPVVFQGSPCIVISLYKVSERNKELLYNFASIYLELGLKYLFFGSFWEKEEEKNFYIVFK